MRTMQTQRLAREAGRFLRHAMPAAKQVLPKALKPLHSIWHEIIGFLFLSLAGLCIWHVARHPGELEPVKLALVILFILVMTFYGISSFRKARRISRS